jgi:uncharacterized membrane protein
MNELKQRAAVLITLALVGVLINIVMFKAGIGNWLLVLITIAFGIYGAVTLRKSM